MAYRKFFTGDEVVIDHYRYPSHVQHRGMVVGTRRNQYRAEGRSPLISYRVECACGASLLPLARHMDLVSTAPTSDVRDMRRRHFLQAIGVTVDSDDTLRQQVDAVLGILTERQRAIIIQRFGLSDEARHTLQAIAEGLGVSKQYINEVERQSLQKLRSFPGLVKEPA